MKSNRKLLDEKDRYVEIEGEVLNSLVEFPDGIGLSVRRCQSCSPCTRLSTIVLLINQCQNRYAMLGKVRC